MTIYSKARKLSLIASHPHILTCQTRYLFILSHMRSRSSVLSHVLGSNPEICGYSELHFAYRRRLDLLRMRAELYNGSECRLDNKYLLDKLLHNECVIADEVLDVAKPKVIFLLRDPVATLRSVIDLGRRTGVDWYGDPHRAAAYYCRRLAALENYADKLKGNYFFLEANDIVERTEPSLAALTHWLNLREPLSKNYSRFRNTGKRHFGDSSANIRAGVIKPTTPRFHIKLPADVLKRTALSYDSCKRKLLDQKRADSLQNIA